MNSMTIADNVRARRKKMDMTASDLAKKAGISQTMMSFIENGGKNPSVKTLIALATALECKVDDLVR